MSKRSQKAKRAARYWKAISAFGKDDKRGLAQYMRAHQTPGERDVWNYLQEQNWLWEQVLGRGHDRPRWRRQGLKYGFIADFYCPFYKLVVEVDGASHFKPERRAMDHLKDKVFAEKGIKVVRVRWPFEEPPKVFMPKVVEARRADLAALARRSLSCLPLLSQPDMSSSPKAQA